MLAKQIILFLFYVCYLDMHSYSDRNIVLKRRVGRGRVILSSGCRWKCWAGRRVSIGVEG